MAEQANPRMFNLAVGAFACLVVVVILATQVAGLRYRSRLTGVDPADVTLIVLRDHIHTPEETRWELDPEQREKFLSLLKTSHLFAPNHPTGGRTYEVILETRSETFVFSLHVGGSNGSFVWLFSRGHEGWNYGTLRNNDFEPFVESIEAAHGVSEETR